MLHRSIAWANLCTITLPDTVTHSVILPVVLTFLICGCGLTIVQCIAQLRGGSPTDQSLAEDGDGGSGGINENTQPLVERDFHHSPEGLDEDIYGMGIAALIRDSQRFALGTECKGLRASRLMVSLLTMFFTMTLQIFILVQMKTLVTSVSTNQAQDQYQKFEVLMYGNDKSKMTTISNGQVRGNPALFNATLFDTMTDDDKDTICQVPLSQPTFFIGLLLVWTLVCFTELRHSADLVGSIIYSTPTVSSMKDSIQETEELGDEAVIVVGLTVVVKVLAVVLILIPRMFVAHVLL